MVETNQPIDGGWTEKSESSEHATENSSSMMEAHDLFQACFVDRDVRSSCRMRSIFWSHDKYGYSLRPQGRSR